MVNSREISQRKSQENELERQANSLELFSVAFPDLAFILDEDGVFQFVLAERNSEELLIADPSEIIGRESGEVLPGELGQTVTENVQEVIASGSVQDFEYSLAVSGAERWFEARIERLPFELDDERTVVAVVRDITDRKEQETELGDLADELEALNRVVRHDIRNDMSIVLGWAQMLEDHVDGDGKEILEKILASGEHIVELTDIARDYVQSLTQPGDMDVKPVAVRSVLRTEIDLRRESYPEAEFIVIGEIPDMSVKANDMLSAVFRNTLNNAVQDNKGDNPEVIVSAESDDGGVDVRFADNGPGIPDAQKETVFGRGEKGLDSTGTGIGLYLIRTLVEQWDGSVRVHGNEPTGTAFEVRLLRSE